MRLIFCYSCLLVLGSCTGNLLSETLDALENGLEYLNRKAQEINLDTVFYVRQTQDQLQSYLDSKLEAFEEVRPRLEKLRDLAKQTADEAIPYVEAQNPEYFKRLGMYLEEKEKIQFYQSKETSEDYVVEALNCSVHHYDMEMEHDCFHALAGGDGKVCQVPQSCFDFNEQYQQRSYALTSQVLFWQQMQSYGCVESLSVVLQKRLCSNVMRDVKQLEKTNFPEGNRDIFVEQIGFCGFWGFRDFNQPEWLQNILEWQQDSGCFTYHFEENCFDEAPEESQIGVKISENELLLEDGCYSHATGASMVALVANVRFEAEKLHQSNIRNENSATIPSKSEYCVKCNFIFIILCSVLLLRFL